MIERDFPGMEDAGMTKFDLIKAISQDINAAQGGTAGRFRQKWKL